MFCYFLKDLLPKSGQELQSALNFRSAGAKTQKKIRNLGHFDLEPLEQCHLFPPTRSGSDGHDYLSECHLAKWACERRHPELRVRYLGRCNPCAAAGSGNGGETSQCPAGLECHLQEIDELDAATVPEVELPRQPQCLCQTDCPDKFVPVCASNGKTVRVE